MNVLMMVSWYNEYDPNAVSTSFHYAQAVSLKKYCNMAIYYPYDREIQTDCVGRQEGEIYVYRSKYQLEKKIQNRLYMYRAMKMICNEFKPDIIHAQVATEAGRFAIILGKLFHIPVMITEHSSPDYSGVTSFPHKVYADFAYKYSKYNACVSDYVTHRLQEIFPKYHFHTIYNGIVTDIVPDCKIEYRVPGSVNMCIVAGHYDKEIKGIPMLFHVLKNLKQEGYALKLHLVGSGEYTNYFKELAAQLEISDVCIFHGTVSKEEVYSIMKQMDFLVSASQIESFGCNIAEALVMGKPVVATRCGGPESIVNVDNGILIEKNDYGELQRAIEEMIHNYSLYNSDVISKEAVKKFSVDKISNEYYRVYKSILA